jgi:hypothetical protein
VRPVKQQLLGLLDDPAVCRIGAVGEHTEPGHGVCRHVRPCEPVDRRAEDARERLRFAHGHLPLAGLDAVDGLRVVLPAERGHLLSEVGLRHPAVVAVEAHVPGDPFVDDAGRRLRRLRSAPAVSVVWLVRGV